VCNGPRIDHYAPGEDGEEIIEHLISFVNVCIQTLVRKERFDARLSDVRVDESQVLLTDSTHSMMARFADALGFRDGVFRLRGERSKPLAVGDVLDVHALGYADAWHKKMQPWLEFYPTCLVTRYVQHVGRDVPGERVSALIERARLEKQEELVAMPEVHALPAHAVTRKQRTARRQSLAAHSSFCSAAARAGREGHVAALTQAMQTKLQVVFDHEDMLLQTTTMLIPRTVSLVMRVNKAVLARVLKLFSPEGAHHWL